MTRLSQSVALRLTAAAIVAFCVEAIRRRRLAYYPTKRGAK